ncbi:hypothetical protein NKG94_40260 [Micromonospora sp. M12]
MNTRSKLRAGVLLGSALALVAGLPGTAALASTGAPAAISAGRLVLEPTGNGWASDAASTSPSRC